MSKYFYLLLFLSFQLCFCYDFMSEKDESYHPKRRRLNKKRNNAKLYENHNEKLFENPHMSLGLEGDDETLAHIDVASFIERPEKVGLNEANFFKSKSIPSLEEVDRASVSELIGLLEDLVMSGITLISQKQEARDGRSAKYSVVDSVTSNYYYRQPDKAGFTHVVAGTQGMMTKGNAHELCIWYLSISMLNRGHRKLNPYSRRKPSNNNKIEARADFVNFEEKSFSNDRDFDPNSLLADETNQVVSQHTEATKKEKNARSEVEADYGMDNVDKRALHLFKFPFFSRNKSEILKPKANKKRKLFTFETRPDNLPEKQTTNTTTGGGSHRADEPTEASYKVQKRSYKVRLCPMCKKIYHTDRMEVEARNLRNKRNCNEDNRNHENPIHNSRQFFQQTSELLSVDEDTITEPPVTPTEEDYEDDDEPFAENNRKENADGTPNSDDYELSETNDSERGRNKRNVDEAEDEKQLLASQPEKHILDADQQRQLAEIDLVERKIDAVKIIKPDFDNKKTTN